MKIKKNVSLKESARKYMVWVLLAIPAVTILAAGILNLIPNVSAKPEPVTLQQSIDMSEADYRNGLNTAQDDMVQQCVFWQALAEAKIAMFEYMHEPLPANLDKTHVYAVVCESPAIRALVPLSF